MPVPQSIPTPWALPEEKLLAECRVDSFVGPGPGGQKRHKTNAAVRITHLPTRISATATDSRSHRENQIHAIRNLRHKLAMEIRRDIDVLSYRAPEFLLDYPGLHINPKNPLYASAVADVMDVLKSAGWSPTPAAATLGVSTSALTRFLYDDPPLWTKVNQVRAALGMAAIRWNRA